MEENYGFGLIAALLLSYLFLSELDVFTDE